MKEKVEVGEGVKRKEGRKGMKEREEGERVDNVWSEGV